VAFAATPSSVLSQKSPDAQAIATAVDRNGHVSILVEFALPTPPAQLRPDPAALAAIKGQIVGVQNAIISQHFGHPDNPPPVQAASRGHCANSKSARCSQSM